MLRRFALSLAVGFAAFAAGPVFAEVVAEPLPGDPNLVVFPFDANNSYRVLTRPGAVTHIVLEPDERLKLLVLGDTVAWQGKHKDNHVFIKPTYPSRTTSGTLLTTKREYQLLLVSTFEQGRWYQRVSFIYPDLLADMGASADRDRLEQEIRAVTPQQSGNASPTAPVTRTTESEARDLTSIDPAALNFNYRIDGVAAFRPVRVYDDGHTTYIRLPEGEDVPALFRVRAGEVELVDYTMRGSNTIVVPRVLEGGLLKLGKEEVRFTNLSKSPRSFWSQLTQREAQ
jgi:type IV secretion system protein VirB9